jgi:hypothetical protein
MGTLYYGDNLDILQRYLKDETVDLVYLDPPFNSAQNYNAVSSNPPMLYLPCDPTASHYLGKPCNAILGKDNFRGELTLAL